MMKYACVFIGSTTGNNSLFSEKTIQLAKDLVQRNIGLVYGGANVGLMGLLADTVLEMGGEVIGVMPESLIQKEIAHKNLTHFHQVKSMQDRKMLLAELSDIFIIFPGGLGTLDELFEMWSAAKIGLHNKPIGILNIDSYFNLLLQFMQHAVNNNFMKQTHLNSIYVHNDSSLLLGLMNNEKK